MSADTIFVMDEHQDSLDLISDILTEAGYKVMVADCLRDALTTLDAIHPSLAILDMDRERFDWFKEISAKCVRDLVPLVVLSSRGYPDPGCEGVTAFVEKPFTSTQLLGAVQSLLQEKRA